MTQHIESRDSEVPGSRTRVTLDVSELSLPMLLEGINAERCWLVDAGDGVYRLCVTQRFRESRAQPGEPAMDLLVRLVNEFADLLNADDVPDRLRVQWDEMVDTYKAQTAPRADASR